MPEFSVIIPSRSRPNIEVSIGRLREYEGGIDIIVVDDGIEDRPQLGCRYVDGIKPFVFSRNINVGVRAAPEGNDIVLMNDDAILETPYGLSSISRLSFETGRNAIISPAIDFVGNPNQRFRGVGVRSEPRMLCFVCVYIPRRVWNLVGEMDERFVGYGCDDDDYCLRARQLGVELWVYDRVKVNHSMLRSEFRGRGAGDFRENLLRFKDKWGHDNWGRY